MVKGSRFPGPGTGHFGLLRLEDGASNPILGSLAINAASVDNCGVDDCDGCLSGRHR